MFYCKNCGRDTLTQPHKPNCPALIEQTVLKCRELGIPFTPEAYQLPLKLDGG